ncbi:MAG: hypothetical protein ABJE66_15055 [Deltaproteobacteria bacterium]
MRIATSSHLTASIVVGIVAAVAIAVGIASSLAHRPPTGQLGVDVSPPADRDLEIQPSSSSVIHEPPPPPEGPFYASLFVAGSTWDLPCRWQSRIRVRDDEPPSGTQRCRVESVEVTADTASARIACWYVADGTSPHPAVNTYVMTSAGLYKAANAPSTRGEPMFTPHPVAKALPKRWGYEEPRGATWANAIVPHHHGWCTSDEFQSLDYYAGDTECISRHGIVGVSHMSMGMEERCGDVPE